MSSEWKPGIFGNLVSFITEKTKVQEANFVTYISTENMQPNFGGVVTAAALPRSGSVTKFKTGDTLFSNIRTYFKKIWQAKFDGYCSNDVLVFRSKNELTLDPNYLHNLCRWEKFTEFSVRTSKGAKMPRGDKDALAQFQFNLPSLEEQREITYILDTLDDRITLLRETNQTLEAIAQAIFKSWFVDFDPVRAKMEGRAPEGMDEETATLFPDAFEESELGLMPKGWEVGALRNCCKKIESGGTPKRNLTEYWDGNISWLTSGEVRNPIVFDTKEKITLLGMKNSSAKLWPEGTTVVAMYGATAGEVCFLANAMTANQACCGLIPIDSLRSFLFFLVRRERQALALKSSGSAQQNLNKGLVERHPVIIPSFKILAKFEQNIGVILTGWLENERQIQTLAETRDTLLPRLISGKLRLLEAKEQMENALL